MATESGTSVRGSYINLQAQQQQRGSEDEVAESGVIIVIFLSQKIHPQTILNPLTKRMR